MAEGGIQMNGRKVASFPSCFSVVENQIVTEWDSEVPFNRFESKGMTENGLGWDEG